MHLTPLFTFARIEDDSSALATLCRIAHISGKKILFCHRQASHLFRATKAEVSNLDQLLFRS